MRLFFAGGEEQELGMAAAGRSTLSRLHWLGGGAWQQGMVQAKGSGLPCPALHLIF